MQRAEECKLRHLAASKFIDLAETAARLGVAVAATDGRLLKLSFGEPGQTARVPTWTVPLFGNAAEELLKHRAEQMGALSLPH